jgi:hypothetical protein
MTSRASISSSSSSHFAPPHPNSAPRNYPTTASPPEVPFGDAIALLRRSLRSLQLRNAEEREITAAMTDKSKHQAEQNKAKRRKLRQHWRPSWCVRIYTGVDFIHGARRFEYVHNS